MMLKMIAKKSETLPNSNSEKTIEISAIPDKKIKEKTPDLQVIERKGNQAEKEITNIKKKI